MARPTPWQRSAPLTLGLALCTCVTLMYLVSPNRKTPHAFGSGGYGSRQVGQKGSKEYAMYLTSSKEPQVSFWHDVPMDITELDSQRTVTTVIEIPRGTIAKMEIIKELPWNPIKQDTKNGQLRVYPMPLVAHYGAIPQTYEHPEEEDDLTGLLGDGDPIDLLDISTVQAKAGEVYKVKVLGALAMKDDDAADWKIIAIRATDPAAAHLDDLAQIQQVAHVTVDRSGGGGEKRHVTTTADVAKSSLSPALQRVRDKLETIKNFFRDYKKKNPTDPPPVAFDYDGLYLDAATAVEVVRHHHIHWCSLVDAATAGRRVGMLSSNAHAYQTACDDARSRWAAQLEAGEGLGAATGSKAAVPEGVWIPVEAT